jgi:hypothetical protein
MYTYLHILRITGTRSCRLDCHRSGTVEITGRGER